MGKTVICWILFLVAVIGLAAHTIYLQPWTLDDAYISFRYAEHFGQGKGIVYNEGERVEGYTTFLWVFLLGLGHMAGCYIPILAKTLGMALSIGCLLLLAFSHKITGLLDIRASAIAPLLLGTCGMFTVWAMSGMEVPLVGFLVLLSALLHLKSRSMPEKKGLVVATGISCALATMSRPECGLVFLVLFTDRLIDGIKRRNWAFFWFGLAFSSLYVPYFIWRYTYYGFLLPNTFYAKVGYTKAQVIRGARYTKRFAGLALLILVPVIASLVPVPKKFRKEKCRGTAALVCVIIVHTVYVILVGGDVMPAYRFFSPFMPLICLLSATALAAFIRRPAWVAVVLTIMVAYNVTQLSIRRELRERVLHGNVGRYGKVVGLWMKENFPPDTVIATNTAGSIPYYSKLKTIDMFGLNDVHIAHRHIRGMGRRSAGHEKSDGKYVLSLEPDYIQFGSSRGKKSPSFRGDREIYKDPEFIKNYELKTYQLPGIRNLYLYKRIDRQPSG
jgi:hypothetical protein